MNAELSQEQERLESVLETIKEQIRKQQEETASLKVEVIEFRKHFWDDVKVNTDTFDDYLETIIALRQQAQVLSLNQISHRQAYNRLAALRRMQEIPYFGRIDYTEKGTTVADRIYIGVSTLTDSTGENFLVYDWRSPVASVYYDFPPGPAEYTTPEGVIGGRLEQKWQYIIRGGVIKSMFDTSLTIGDEVLQQVLGKGTDKHMHSIVATIQREQNLIIRHDSSRLLVVQGAAGSGKTSAALQRIAYLLYKYRNWLKADQIILFSPNTMFNSYVSQVLPELGEENMQQVTFQEYLDHRLGKSFQLESPYEQLEYILTAENDNTFRNRKACIQFKASTHYFGMIKSYAKSLEKSGMLFKDIIFRGKPIATAKEISERFYSSDPALRLHNRLEKLTEWLDKKVSDTEKLERRKPWVDEEIQLLSKDVYQKAYRYLLKKRGISEDSFDDYEFEHDALCRWIVRRRLKPLRKRIQKLHFVDLKGIYKRLFSESMNWFIEETPKEWKVIRQSTMRMLEDGKLFYEDATPYLLLQELILGFQTNLSIRHVLVDEAQDYSPFQFEFLKRLFPSARMTVLGDFNQAIFAHASHTIDFQTLQDLYGIDETDTINLTRSYRSTKPIIDFTRGLVPGGERINAFERDGEKPVLTLVSDHAELHSSIISKVTALQNHQYNTIAIICKSAAESNAAFESLKGIAGCKLVTGCTIEYEQGIVVIPAYLAKGIEFDAVIIYDASAQVYHDESLRRLFYTACTRAMHHLQLYSIGVPSPLLSNVSPESFIMD